MTKQKLVTLPESLQKLEFIMGTKDMHPEMLVPEMHVELFRHALITAYYDGRNEGLIRGFKDGINACEP